VSELISLPACCSIPQLAEKLSIHRATAWRLVATGQLRAFRLGPRCIRVPLTEVERFLAESAR
jgi:excisionase family DNA binding protein